MASRWPQRFLVAAFISRSTSASVRYSRVRRSALGGRLGPDCSVYGGWRDQLEVPFGHVLRTPCPDDCSYNGHSLDSRQRVRSGINIYVMTAPVARVPYFVLSQ